MITKLTMIIRPISLAVCMFAICYSAAASQNDFYVAPSGSDYNPGTRDQPFQSFQRAKKAVAKAIPSMSSDITVIFASGMYPITETIQFGPSDSPKGDYNITYKAAEGHKPVFTGGVPLEGWVQYNDKLWKAPLRRDHKLRALYVNDQRAVMACSRRVKVLGGWGSFKVTAGQADWAWQSGEAADGVQYSENDLPKITRNLSDVEIENKSTWNTNFVGVREIVKKGDTFIFKFQQPYGAIAQQIAWYAGLQLDQGYHVIHNAFELLDEPGEFYFDRSEQMVYYYPRPADAIRAADDMRTAEVIVPVTETLLRIDGKELQEPVRNLIFDGLTFAHTDYNLLEIDGSVGKSTVQTSTVYTAFANVNWHLDLYRAYDVLPGAIMANIIENVEFTRNTIAHTGSEGLALNNGIKNVRVIGNVIRDCGGSAIVLGHPQHMYENDTPDLKHPKGAGIDKEKYPSGSESAPRNVVIANNFLPENAALFNGHTIITVFIANGVKIEHNWIPNAPYTGISVGWGWGEFDGFAEGKEWALENMWITRRSVLPGKPTTVAGNHLIRANRIEETMSMLNDGGGIYTLGDMPGTVFERNYIRDTNIAIYTDEGSANILSRYNVIGAPYGLAHYADGKGRKHDIRAEHYFINGNKWAVDARSGVVVDFQICELGQWPAEAQQIIDASGLEPEWRYLSEKWEKMFAVYQAAILAQAAKEGRYEAELAKLSGTAHINTKHPGFSGKGFVSGYSNVSANTTFEVNVPRAGTYDLTIRYSAGAGDCNTVALTVNGQEVKVLECKSTGSWEEWADHSESISLKSGVNEISLQLVSESGSPLNLDYIKISK